MFERECDLRELTGDGKEASLGRVYLRILYDEDVYGARIVASKFSEEANGEMNEDEVYLCNHLIAMQTNLDVDEEKKKCSWSGLDFSVDPPRYRKFLATFFEESDAGDGKKTVRNEQNFYDYGLLLAIHTNRGPRSGYSRKSLHE